MKNGNPWQRAFVNTMSNSAKRCAMKASKAYAFHPRSDGRAWLLLWEDQILGELHVEDRELVIEYAKIFSRLFGVQIRVIGAGANLVASQFCQG